jgi:hypothetical protein
MHRKRITPYVLASGLTLAGCAGGVATTSVNSVHLSTDRADVVTAALVANGVEASRVRHADNGTAFDGDTGVSNRRFDIAGRQAVMRRLAGPALRKV